MSNPLHLHDCSGGFTAFSSKDAAQFRPEEKPPLGIMPRQIWLEKRASEIARALHENIEAGRWGRVRGWANELTETLQLMNPSHNV